MRSRPRLFLEILNELRLIQWRTSATRIDLLAAFEAMAAARLAEAGVGEFMLMSIMGWTNPSQAKVYTEKAARKKMAEKGMRMLDDEEQT